MMSKLYELNQSWLTISDMLENDPTNETLQETFEAINEGIEVKLEYLVKLRREHEANASKFKEEKDYFAKKQKVEENKAARLKEFLEYQLNLMGTKKAKAGLFTLALQNNPPSLEIDDEDIIPENFWKIKKDVDKTSLKKWIAEGNELEGVRLVSSESLRVR
jgi:hypothetical protein